MWHFYSCYWHFYISSIQKIWDSIEGDDDCNNSKGDDDSSKCKDESMRRTWRWPSSGKCEITHWRQVHKEECQQLETYSLSTSLKVATIEETVHERILVDDSMASQFYGSGMK